MPKTSKSSNDKKAAVFCITEKQIDALVKLSVAEICAFLVLAQFTDETGIYSSASVKAIRKHLRVGEPKARKLVGKLRMDRLIFDASSSSQSKLFKEMPRHEGRAEIRNIIPSDDSRKVWIGAELVTGYSGMVAPLRDLCICGDLAARLLLRLYQHEDAGSYYGVNPATAIYRSFVMREVIAIDDDYTLHHAEDDGERVVHGFWESVPGAYEDYSNPEVWGHEDYKLKQVFWRALSKLRDAGFIYIAASVMSGGQHDEEEETTKSQPTDSSTYIYPLHTQKCQGAREGEKGLAGDINNLAREHGVSASDAKGRFYGKFPVLTYADDDVQVLGIYRLRFRNTNSEFEDVKNGWHMVQEAHRKWSGITRRLAMGSA